MVDDPRRFGPPRTDCEKIESELNVAKGDVTRLTFEIARGTSRPEALTALFNRITFSEDALADCLERRTQITQPIDDQPILIPITQPIDDQPILIPVTPPVLEQTKVFGLTLKQLAVLIGLGILIL